MTAIKPATPVNVVDAFYAAPSPAGAVAVAIADHKAANQFPMWDYIAQLQKAEERCNAYPKLVEALKEMYETFKWTSHHTGEDAANKKALDVLRSLGEDK